MLSMMNVTCGDKYITGDCDDNGEGDLEGNAEINVDDSGDAEGDDDYDIGGDGWLVITL